MNTRIQFPQDHVIKTRGNGVCNPSTRDVASEGSMGLLCQPSHLDQCQVSERPCLKEPSEQHLRNTRSCPLAFMYTCTHMFMNILRCMYACVHMHTRMCVRTNVHPIVQFVALFYDFYFSVCLSFKKKIFQKTKKQKRKFHLLVHLLCFLMSFLCGDRSHLMRFHEA